MTDYPEFSTVRPNAARSAPAAIRALILDDNAVDRQRLKRLFRQADLDVSVAEAGTIAEFASKIDAASYDLFLLDYRLVQGDGLIALEMLKRHPRQREAASIMVAGESQIQVAVDAMKNGCADFLLKDMMGPEMLSRSVAHALSSAGGPAAGQAGQSIEGALVRFAVNSGAEMRSILSGMLRRTRAIRHAAASGRPAGTDEVEALDATCARLWEFLEEYHAFVSEFAPESRRLN